MIARHAPSWQLILADLALILFLVTLTALASQTDTQERLNAAGDAQVAASHALFRSEPRGPQIEEWLADQTPDPRATLTIFADHSGADRAQIWGAAEALADRAKGQGFMVRVIITQRERSDIYASLAYDEKPLD